MEVKFVVFYLVLGLVSFASARSPDPGSSDNNDLDTAETNIFGGASLVPNTNSYNDLDSFPYEAPRQPLYDTFAVPQPTFGVSINTKALLAPQVEVLRLIEGFIQLLGDIMARFQSLINDNYDFIRAVVNLVVKKISFFQNFSLKGISVFRKILEFILNLFANFSITLPSITFGTSGDPMPHDTYGVPQNFNTTSFI